MHQRWIPPARSLPPRVHLASQTIPSRPASFSNKWPWLPMHLQACLSYYCLYGACEWATMFLPTRPCECPIVTRMDQVTYQKLVFVAHMSYDNSSSDISDWFNMMSYDSTHFTTYYLVILDSFTMCLYWQSILLSIYYKMTTCYSSIYSN
jgi:hypothetical protein